MPVTLRVTNGDIAIENNNLVLIDGEDSLLQRIRSNILFFRGEWFADRTRGVPWFQDVFVKNPNPSVLNAIFGDVIRGVQGVRSLDLLTFDLDSETRQLTIQFQVSTDDDTLTGDVILGV